MLGFSSPMSSLPPVAVQSDDIESVSFLLVAVSIGHLQPYKLPTQKQSVARDSSLDHHASWAPTGYTLCAESFFGRLVDHFGQRSWNGLNPRLPEDLRLQCFDYN